jgi:hypothetical protein
MSRAPAEFIGSPSALGASYATLGVARGGRGALASGTGPARASNLRRVTALVNLYRWLLYAPLRRGFSLVATPSRTSAIVIFGPTRCPLCNGGLVAGVRSRSRAWREQPSLRPRGGVVSLPGCEHPFALTTDKLRYHRCAQRKPRRSGG